MSRSSPAFRASVTTRGPGHHSSTLTDQSVCCTDRSVYDGVVTKTPPADAGFPQNVATAGPARAGLGAWLSLIVLTLAVVLLAVDGTVLALAIPALTADLNPSGTEILWMGDIY